MLWDMNRSQLRQVFALILGFFVALGMSTSVVQASDMAVKMAVASDMGGADHGKCDGCGDNGPGMKVTGCGVAVCTTSAVAALPQTLSITWINTRELPLLAQLLLVGWVLSPDPHPPRLSDLG